MNKIEQLENSIELLLNTPGSNYENEEVRKLCLIELINEKLLINEAEY
mgnify:CR=1 FL=1